MDSRNKEKKEKKNKAKNSLKQVQAKPKEDATQSTACCRLLMSTADANC